jgi:peptide/nickel transport system substrate-binding protein
MSQATRRSFAFGAAMMLAVTALTATPVGAQDGDVPQGGTIVVGEWQRATQLNPYLSNALRDVEGARPAMRTLGAVNDEGEFVPELLAEFPTLDNGGVVPDEDGAGFTLNLVLQDGLGWSDGTPLTLHDYKWDYDWASMVGASGEVACPYCAQLVPLKDPSITGAEGWDPSNQRVDSFEVSEDGLTAAIHFEENFAGWITMITEIYLISPSFWSEVAIEDIATAASIDSPLLLDMPTSGPFKILAASSEGIDYGPNEFWAADSGPNLDQLRMRYFGSKDGMFAAFLNGEIDLTLNTTLADVAALQSVSPDVGRAIVDTGWQYEHVTFNHEASDVGLDDANVRRALAMAIDKRALLDVLFPGAGLEPACSNAPPAQWYAAEGIVCDAYDPEGAAALLDEAGWTVDPDLGIRAKDGNAMRIRMCTSSGNPVRLTTLGRISQDWGAISVGADIQTETPAVYFGSYDETTSETDCNIYRGTFDVALYTDQLSPDPFSDWYTSYHSSQPATDEFPSGLNILRVADSVLDDLVDKLGEQMTEEGIKDVAAEISAYLVSISGEVALYYRPEPSGIGNHLGGFEEKNPSTATSLWDVENWYFIP